MTGPVDALVELRRAANYITDARQEPEDELWSAVAAVAELVEASGIALLNATDISGGTYEDSDNGTTHWGCCHKRLDYWPREDHSHTPDCWTHKLRAALAKFGGAS